MAEPSNADAMVSGLKVSDILLPHPSLPNSMCLGPRSSESPAHLISCEANRIPFVNQNLDLTSWADCLRAWPNPPEGWVPWYNRVSKTHYATWESIGIADALSLSLSPLEKNENILKTIGYFWSDALNCFMFGHGPMTPTLLDVAMITGLDIASPSPSAFKLPKVPFTLSSKKECTSWGAYLNRYMKTKGPVTEREHTAFLNFWLEHFIFCGPSLAPTKNYLSLAYELAKGTHLGIGKLFLGELWAQLYFRDQIPDFPPLTSCTFPDVNGKDIRCTSYGQALYGLPGSRLIPKEAAGWFKIFFQGLDNPLAELPDILTGQRCYTFFDALALPIPHNLRFSFTTDGFETWWSMWKTHVFRRALGPLLKQLDAAHDISADQINETSSGVVEEVPMPSTAPGPSNSPRVTDQVSDQRTAKPIVTTSASLPFLGEGCDPSSLLTFDPDSIEPAAPKIGEEPNLGAVDGPLQRLKVLLSSPVDTLVEDPETIRGILVDIQPRLPVVEAKLADSDFIKKCQRLNEKKAALDAKTATSTHSVRLETLRKELEDLEKRARETKRLIQDEESLIARSQEEAQGLTADLKTDLAEIRALSSQLVMGRDEDDEVEIAEVDRIRADALHALNAFLRRASLLLCVN
ncbi:hypothetical protein QYE76_063575 [Lolium multiflorum]|uniref:Aminotransferase-like plant mobile domain-containing protein n=1 Tax=Lolium multiflorum TaxID=4521 RepID=A0AAD8W8A9_LOLMU|nr:hypothetical protein QYE76_063575 [Lolium multiflorum]